MKEEFFRKSYIFEIISHICNFFVATIKNDLTITRDKSIIVKSLCLNRYLLMHLPGPAFGKVTYIVFSPDFVTFFKKVLF